MKFVMRYQFLALCLLGVFLIAVSTTEAQTFEIGTWGNFCQGAISHTFDDYPLYGATHIVSTGRAAFDAKGFHMTIFTITGGDNTGTWTALDSAFAHGHEIASHSVTHPTGTMPASELGPSQLAIQQNVPGEKCATIAYPNCNTPGDNLVLQYYIAGRNCYANSINPKSPANWAQINANGFGTGTGGYPNDVTSLNNFANGAATNNGWAVAMHHGIGTDTHSWAVTNLDTLIKHLAYLDQNRAKIWVENFGNVARYIHERDSSKITVKSSSGTSITITVTNNLKKDSIYNFPLSIRTQRPGGWTSVTVKQAGKDVWDSIVTVGTTPYIMFKAVPDAGDVVLSSGTSSVIRQFIGNSGNAAPVMRKNATLLIDSRQFGSSGCDVTFFDLQGKILAHYQLAAHESSITLAIDKFNCSVFLVKITGGNKTFLGKFVSQL